MPSEKRDELAVRRFFQKAIIQHSLPAKVVIDNSGSNAAALDTINWSVYFSETINYSLFFGYDIGCFIEVLQIKGLNNIVEQRRRAVKWKM